MINWLDSIHKSTLEDSPGFLINRTALRIKREFQRMLHDRGLQVTPEQCVVLWRLWNFEGGVQRELAVTTFKDMTNLTRILDGLERRGLVVRRRDEHDRRCSRVFLTDQGRVLRHDVLTVAGELASRAYKGLNDDQIENFKIILNAVHANLNGIPDTAE
jgi:DNA-binding MarR family transcriptional regulator